MSGAVLPPTPIGTSTGTETPTALDKPKPRNHNRNSLSGKPRFPLTLEQQQQITTMAANGYSAYRISQTIGKGINLVKRHLDTEGVMEQVKDEQAELVEIYRDRARECAVAITPEKIAKASVLQLATSSGILLDKSLLLSGKPTQNIGIIVEVLDVLRKKDEEEIERQTQQAQARLLAEKAKP